ncbi:response regulator transcription factor [Sulfuricurvum sp.]|uniref:response regulator transcription factor n=1 Tax=Sulfuricurvum sp. TaxID=2025608 RepID=UPI002619D4FA|nr:response regulator transcription factor [Sulfuricurvum sp.]MDD3597359.1 response regulator transcription factor [Sulfuricurvum sp.]
MKLALIEDDLILSDTLNDIFSAENFDVFPIFSFTNAQDALFENRFDIIIMDVNLPDGNGFDLAKSVRDMGVATPILFLTSEGSAESVVSGFQSGGDDYLKKPFEPTELLARIQNLLRRTFLPQHSNLLTLSDTFFFDPIKEQVLTSDAKSITLHTKELEALKLLLSKKGQIVSYDEFFDTLWGYGNDPGIDALRAHIKNLRKTLGDINIETIRLIGYRLA